MALWGGRFTQAADKRFKDFNDSLRFDYRLAEQDIEGSIGWSKALVNVGVLSAEEQQQRRGECARRGGARARGRGCGCAGRGGSAGCGVCGGHCGQQQGGEGDCAGCTCCERRDDLSGRRQLGKPVQHPDGKHQGEERCACV